MSTPLVSFRVPSPTPVKTPLFALIIGINKYKVSQFCTLRGAEPDALAFKSYLENDLQVPAAQIKVLLNEQATRSNIIEAFETMATDPLIMKDDAIVVFYAGHGTELVDKANPGAKIQMLVPHDFSSDPEQAVMTITDRHLERLIGNIAGEKGDNITVIFDCCHSASGTRSIDESLSATVVRSVEISVPFRHVLDEPVSRDLPFGISGPQMPREPRRKTTVDFHRPAGLQSHILLSACGESEQAKEISGRGNFSASFLRLLRTHSPDQLRYCDILTHMDAIQGQNPQVQGNNSSRILFNAKVAGRARSFPVKLGESSSGGSVSVLVKAGSAHGVTLGAEFALYAASDVNFEERLALSTVISVKGFTSTLEDLPQFKFTYPCVAMQTRAGQREDARLFVPPEDPFHAMFKTIRDDQHDPRYNLQNIILVADNSHAHLKATMEGPNVLLEVVDQSVTRYGFAPKVRSIDVQDPDRIAWTFDRAAHFYRELNRTNTDSDTSLTAQVLVEFYRLKENDDDDLEAAGKNICSEGTIDMVVDEDIPYGMKLVNKSRHDLYPYLFWFDNNDLSIKDCYLSPALPNVPYIQDIPLPRRRENIDGELCIGYGFGSGRQPFCFDLKSLENWQHLDVSFFKLFLSTKPIDLSYIPQSSPFEIDRGLGQYQPKRKVDRWDTILIPVIQRRVPFSEN